MVLQSIFPLEELLTQYSEIFKSGLGHSKELKAKLYLKDGVMPKFNRPRSTAIAMKSVIQEELDHQKKLGILEKIATAEWSAPVVPVIKVYWSHSFMWGLRSVCKPTLAS